MSRGFEINITIQGRNPIETHAMLDTAATVDIISVEFAEEASLEKVGDTNLSTQAANQVKMPQYGLYTVPFTITDSRGITRALKRTCLAIDRDPRPYGIPILLAMPTLIDEDIHLEPATQSWWFNEIYQTNSDMHGLQETAVRQG